MPGYYVYAWWNLQLAPHGMPSVLPDLLAAIHDHFESQGLSEVIPGGLKTKKATGSDPLPYATVKEKYSKLEMVTNDRNILLKTIEFIIYGPDLDEAASMGDVIHSAFDGVSLEYEVGFTSRFQYETHMHGRDFQRSTGEAEGWFQARTYQVRAHEARP